MSNSDPSAKPIPKKLPKVVIMMIEKNNMVMAIKTLAADEDISMNEAKIRIDDYEAELKLKQQQKLSSIATKQGIPNATPSASASTSTSGQDLKRLQKAVDNQLHDIGYKKPLVPYWGKRLFIMTLIMLGLFGILWRVFG